MNPLSPRAPSPDAPTWPTWSAQVRDSLTRGLRDAATEDPAGWPEALDLVAYISTHSEDLAERHGDVIARTEALPDQATVNVALLGAWGAAALGLDVAQLLVHAVAQDTLECWVPVLLFYIDAEGDDELAELIARSIARLDPSGEAIMATIAASMLDSVGFTPEALSQMAANIRTVAERDRSA